MTVELDEIRNVGPTSPTLTRLSESVGKNPGRREEAWGARSATQIKTNSCRASICELTDLRVLTHSPHSALLWSIRPWFTRHYGPVQTDLAKSAIIQRVLYSVRQISGIALLPLWLSLSLFLSLSLSLSLSGGGEVFWPSVVMTSALEWGAGYLHATPAISRVNVILVITIHWTNVCLIVGQDRRRLANVKPILVQCVNSFFITHFHFVAKNSD